MSGFGLTHRRRALSGLVTGIREPDWPQWVKLSLEVARLAPSSVNRQPWRFKVEADSITLLVNMRSRKGQQKMSRECGYFLGLKTRLLT
jgi:hypothetical protein